MAVLLRSGDEVARVSSGEFHSIAGLASSVVRTQGVPDEGLAALRSVLAVMQPALSATETIDVHIELSESERSIVELLHAQIWIRNALPVRISHECPTCGVKTLSNSDYDALLQRNRKMSALSGLGLAVSGTVSPFFMVGRLLQLRKTDPDFVCPRCKGLDSVDSPVTFCPSCKALREEAVLLQCADCGHDFGSDVAGLKWQPAESIPLPPPAPRQETTLEVGGYCPAVTASADGARLVAARIPTGKSATAALVYGMVDLGQPPLAVVPTAIRGDVSEVAISADGSRIAVAGDKAPRTLEVWDVAGQPQRLMASAMRHHASVAISPDGARVASAGTVWDVDSGTVLWEADHRPRGKSKFEPSYSHMAFSPDNRLVVYATWNQTGVADAETGELLAELDVPGYAFAFGRDSHLFATYINEGVTQPPRSYKVQVWDIERAEPTFSAEGKYRNVRSIAFSTDGNRIAVAEVSSGKQFPASIRVWDHDSGKEIWQIPQETPSLAFLEDGARLAFGAMSKVSIFELGDSSGATAC
jgi:predicted RNA-binding Zn-ribbon protein involved in translation (DUF1610 family)